MWMISDMFSIIQQRYFLLRNQQYALVTTITSVWVEAQSIQAQLSLDTHKLHTLQKRLCDANESLTAHGISNIVSGAQNTGLRRTVLLMTLKRNDLHMQIESLRFSICDLQTKYNLVMRNHRKLCCEIDVVDKELGDIKYEIGYDTQIFWNHMYDSYTPETLARR